VLNLLELSWTKIVLFSWLQHLLINSTLIKLHVRYKFWTSTLLNFLHPVTSYFLNSDILLRTLFSFPFNLYSCHRMRWDQVSHPHKIRSIVLCILSFRFLDDASIKCNVMRFLFCWNFVHIQTENNLNIPQRTPSEMLYAALGSTRFPILIKWISIFRGLKHPIRISRLQNKMKSFHFVLFWTKSNFTACFCKRE
jgi:hypothetical protein